jgi:phosphatidate cytidylyltransferase
MLLYLALVVSISSDIGGYVFGKIFKWKKLTKISPKKTISGVFGSYFLSIICLFIFFETYSTGTQVTFRVFLITIIFSTIAQIGDLTISYFKRLEKIKDTGKVLPGHGGIFDRIDGLMFVVILAFIMNFLRI